MQMFSAEGGAHLDSAEELLDLQGELPQLAAALDLLAQAARLHHLLVAFVKQTLADGVLHPVPPRRQPGAAPEDVHADAHGLRRKNTQTGVSNSADWGATGALRRWDRQCRHINTHYYYYYHYLFCGPQ